MNKTLKMLGVAVLASLMLGGCNAPNKLTNKEIKDGWQLLFNGQDLEGWRDYNGEGLSGPWTVVDGVIEATGKGSDSNGYIVTDKEYTNFDLKWEWKISKGGNSGMLYHVVERPGFDVPYITGPEYQLIDDEFETRNLKPAGEWNSSEIIFDNGHVTYLLNGKVTVEFDAWSEDWFARKAAGKWAECSEYGMSRTGHICLQDHGYPAWFRNIKIKELPKPEPVEKDLFNGKDTEGWIVYGTDPWYVDEEGCLVCESGTDNTYGYFGTTEYYDDFDLTLEFKQESSGNSGVFIRSVVPHDVTVSGWQVEVAPPGCDTGGVYESYGRGWLYQIPDEKESILKYGEWNTMRIRLEGDHLQSWLNGEPMTDIHDAKIGNGHGRICLQIHDGGGIKVRWRNIHIKTL